jgi:hypothetical protein
MKIDRKQFIVGIGAFSAVTLRTGSRAAAQLVPGTQIADLGNQGALYRVLLDVGGGRRVSCDAAVLPRRSFAARIVEQRSQSGSLTAVQDIARTTGATVAVNGGRFNGAFSPDGLLIVDGKRVGRKRADWSGYISIDRGGNASVTDKPDLRNAMYAVQGYPMLIEPGEKMGIWREDGKRFRRTVIAQSGDVIIALATVTPASLFELAYALIERPDAFFLNRIDAAINLSGAATTSFYAKQADGDEITIQAYWPNRDVITFTPRVTG